MAWTVGHENIPVGNHIVECAWEVDASSEAEAFANPEAIPYLLVGINVLGEGEKQIDWYTESELLQIVGWQEVVALLPDGAEYPEDGSAYCARLTEEQMAEVAHVMKVTQDGVSMADFTPAAT